MIWQRARPRNAARTRRRGAHQTRADALLARGNASAEWRMTQAAAGFTIAYRHTCLADGSER
jgi:hypothetical protein